MATKLAIASDHAGVDYKKRLIEHLEKQGYDCINLGTDTEESVVIRYMPTAYAEK